MVHLSLLLAVGSSGCCCCSFDLDLKRFDPEEDEEDEEGVRRSDDDDGDEPRPPQKTYFDLGNAAYPDGNDAEAIRHRWLTRTLDPSRYRLGYKLPDDAAATIVATFRDYSRKVGHRQIDETRFQWRPPRNCEGSGLQCVYAELDAENVASIKPLARLFRARAKAEGLDAGRAAELVVSFVQKIPYNIPKNQPFGVLPPALVVKRRTGDCDSKALLAHMILRELGIRNVLVSSDAHAHTMLGVALPSAGASFTYRGTKYAFVELTAEGAPIGHINPKLTRPSDWRVMTEIP